MANFGRNARDWRESVLWWRKNEPRRKNDDQGEQIKNQKEVSRKPRKWKRKYMERKEGRTRKRNEMK